MAEHSMCQPGRPGPSAVSQDCSPGLAAFQRAKSRAASFSYSSTSTRAPSSMPSKSFLESLPYSGKRAMRKYQRAVLGLVGDVLGGEVLDERDHLRNAGGGVRDVLRVLDAEGVEVLEEGALEFGGVFGDGDAGGGGVADDLVVDVGDVHDVVDGDALLAEDAAEHVDVEEGAEVADVAVVVDGGAAAVHAQRGCADWGEGLDLAAEGVEEFDRSHVLSVPAAAGAWRGADCSRLGFPDDFS